MKQQHPFLSALKSAFPHTIPVLTGFLFLGIAYGVLMASNGYSFYWTFLMCTIGYCGSMQYAAIPLLVSAFHPLEVLLLTLTVNARHLFYGLSILHKYEGIGKIKAFLIFTLCDETFSLVSSTEAPEGIEKKWFYFSISLLNYCYWFIFSTLGGLIGQFIPTDIKGIDFVLTALFIVMFLNQLEESKNRIPAMIGIFCTVVSRLVFGSSYFLIPAMVFIFVIILSFEKFLDSKETDEDSNLTEEQTCI